MHLLHCTNFAFPLSSFFLLHDVTCDVKLAMLSICFYRQGTCTPSVSFCPHVVLCFWSLCRFDTLCLHIWHTSALLYYKVSCILLHGHPNMSVEDILYHSSCSDGLSFYGLSVYGFVLIQGCQMYFYTCDTDMFLSSPWPIVSPHQSSTCPVHMHVQIYAVHQ